MSEQAQYLVLDGIHDAKNLIYATWLRSYQASSLMAKLVPRDIFFAEHHKVIDRILNHPNTQIRLAVLPSDPSVILGWAVRQHLTLHYIYVKPAFRRYGIASALIGDQPWSTYSHHTYLLRDLPLHNKSFNPYV